ncbi:hypothetical protein BDF19DRAFT_422850 [Syncephalis fuscata]|nr:hypothetical protein BDF19DRAFT_422850 [Syncephalis fuscata]
MKLPLLFPWLLAGITRLSYVEAHDHMTMTPVEWSAAELEPIDVWLKLHIIIMLVAFGGLFPLGIIFGFTKHRFHVPTQIIAIGLTAFGLVLGHLHGGRAFPHSAHGSGANWIVLMILIQASIGVFLKRYRQATMLRKVAKTTHKTIGILWFVMGGVQCALGVITYMGYCGDSHTNNCLAHEIMGSSIAAYGIAVHLTSSGPGRRWLRRLANGMVVRTNKSSGLSMTSMKNRSVDWADAWLITIWGVFNTFTEHRWGQTWNHTDLQHTSMGVLWWAGGAAGLFSLLHRPEQRTPLPAIVILFTGAGMVAHHQHQAIGVMTHAWFGKALMAAAAIRIVEIALEEGGVGRVALPGYGSGRSRSNDLGSLTAKYGEGRLLPMLRRLSGLLLVISGLLFCGSTEQALASVAGNGLDVVTYMNGIISLGLAAMAYVDGLVLVYKRCRALRQKQLGFSGVDDDGYDDGATIYDTAGLGSPHVAYNPLESPPPSAGPHVLFNEEAEDDNDSVNGHGRHGNKLPSSNVPSGTSPSVNTRVPSEEHEMQLRN